MAQGGDGPPALDRAEQLTRPNPLDAKAHLVLGLLQLDAGAAERALESLRRASFLDPDNPLAQFSLGRAYAQLGDPARARRTLANARRQLVPLADDQPIPDGEGLSAGELLHAIAAQLAALESR